MGIGINKEKFDDETVQLVVDHRRSAGGRRPARKRALITGVSSGLGVETARALVAHGADVVGAARDLSKAKQATIEVESSAQKLNTAFKLVQLDLADLSSVRACADNLLVEQAQFDFVVGNAGVMATPFGHTVDGFETQFGTNHLGHFLFINKVAPLIRKGGRVVMLSSGAHRISDVDLDDPAFERTKYDRWIAYGRSKTANALFAAEFDTRHRSRGVRAAAVHPGGIQTGLQRHYPAEEERALVETINKANAAAGQPPFRYKSVEQGAATSVWAAVVASGEDVGGRYCEDCQVAQFDDADGFRGGVRPYALNVERAKSLWVKSEEMVGESF